MRFCECMVCFICVFCLCVIVIGGYFAYLDYKSDYRIIPLDDMHVKAHETVIIDVPGFKSMVIGPEECTPYHHNKTVVFIPSTPGVYTAVIDVHGYSYYIDTYVVRVIVEARDMLDEPLVNTLDIPTMED